MKEVFSYNSSQTIAPLWDGNYVIFNPQGNVYVLLSRTVMESLPVGFETTIFRKGGTGNIRFTVDQGVYLNCMHAHPQSEKENAVMFLKKTGDSEFWLHGDVKNS